MKPIVAQLPKDQIIAELTNDKLLRSTNNGNNEVYIFDNNNSPALMHEVGRVRELLSGMQEEEQAKRLILTNLTQLK